MVHALKEIWRVLDVGGCLFDLRPRLGDRLFEVVIDGQGHQVEWLDNSPFIHETTASNQAIAHVVDKGWFHLTDQARIEVKVYWDSLDELLTYLEEQDKTTVIMTDTAVNKARQIVDRTQPVPKARLSTPLGLDVYHKTSPLD